MIVSKFQLLTHQTYFHNNQVYVDSFLFYLVNRGVWNGWDIWPITCCQTKGRVMPRSQWTYCATLDSVVRDVVIISVHVKLNMTNWIIIRVDTACESFIHLPNKEESETILVRIQFNRQPDWVAFLIAHLWISTKGLAELSTCQPTPNEWSRNRSTVDI